MNEEIKKITELEFIIITMVALLIWCFGLVLEFFGIGLFISPIFESFFTFGMWLFFRSKNDPYANKAGANIAQYIATAIPIIPTILVSFFVKAYIHNHPKVAGIANVIAK